MIARETWGTPTGVSRQWGLVGWGGATLRRLLWWRRTRDAIGRILRVQRRSALWRLKRRAVARAVRQALGLARPL